MEFGIFLNGYIPGPGAHETELGAPSADARGGVRDLRRQAQLEVRLVRRAPLPDRVQPHVGARGRDGATSPARPTTSTSASGINSLSPRKEHPVRWPSGRRCSTTSPDAATSGAPAAARAATRWPAFNILDTNSTKSEWDEVVREIPRMWEQKDYSYEGEHFTVPTPAQRAAQALRPGPPADLGRLRQPADVPEGR